MLSQTLCPHARAGALSILSLLGNGKAGLAHATAAAKGDLADGTRVTSHSLSALDAGGTCLLEDLQTKPMRSATAAVALGVLPLLHSYPGRAWPAISWWHSHEQVVGHELAMSIMAL